ncbi:MAG: hypothetical protein QG577_2353 [Thermodesulfobacteriota bacterium]|nr:hypothetical protein [Thermodesulfobacteriota bacterium]
MNLPILSFRRNCPSRVHYSKFFEVLQEFTGTGSGWEGDVLEWEALMKARLKINVGFVLQT